MHYFTNILIFSSKFKGYISKEHINKIRVDGDNIIVQEDISHTSENEFLMLCLTRNPNPIKEINKLDATAMIEEVIRYA